MPQTLQIVDKCTTLSELVCALAEVGQRMFSVGRYQYRIGHTQIITDATGTIIAKHYH